MVGTNGFTSSLSRGNMCISDHALHPGPRQEHIRSQEGPILGTRYTHVRCRVWSVEGL